MALVDQSGTAGRFAPGQLVAERFEVVRYLARGGMGEVYEVEDRFLQNVHVALKVIAPEIARDASSARRFEQEVLLARKVVHTNLCPIYDIAHCNDPAPPFLFLTMKLVEGETLSARLRRPGLLPHDEAMTILRQLVGGIAAIHAAGVIHRDIKPNNVMLDTSGTDLCVSIMDFGLARLHDAEATIATQSLMAGTPGYMAPEMLRGQGPSQAADLFALGVLLHQVFTGEHPKFKPLSLAAEASPQLDKAGLPGVVTHSVKELLASEPDRRCVAFEQMKAALALAGPGTHRGADVSFDLGRIGRVSRRQFAIGSAAAASALAAGLAWKRDWVYDRLHPLPPKRFVALVGWPQAAEDRVKTTISSVVDAIGSELARAEAFERDLLIIPRAVGKEITSLSQLDTVREAVGANLILAASGVATADGFRLLLHLIDPLKAKLIRSKSVIVPLSAELQLSEKAVRAAADLLDITRYKPDDQRSKVGTADQAAYAAFQAAESLRKQDNEAGLAAAIEKYKEAIDADPRYAGAQSGLAWAYLRLYGMRRDPGALGLAGLNFRSAISLDPNLAEAHVGLSSYFHQVGDDRGKSQEISRALSLDPTNAHALTYRANYYADDNQWEDAEATFKRIASLRPNYWLAHNEYGAVLEDEGKYPEALTEFHTASILYPKSASALKAVGSIYLRVGRVPEAMEILQNSYAMNPSANTAIALAGCFRLAQRYQDATDYAQRAVKLNPKEPSYWFELGDVYSSTRKNAAEADAAYRRSMAAQEDNLRTTPTSGPGWMLLALCRAKAGLTESTLSLLAKADLLHSDDMDSQLTKVRALELAGKRKDALAVMARCLQRGPTVFQFRTMLDLDKLRADPLGQQMLTSTADANVG